MKVIRNFVFLIIGLGIIQFANKTQDAPLFGISLHLIGLSLLFYPALEALYHKISTQSESDQFKQDFLGKQTPQTKPRRKFVKVILQSGCAVSIYTIVFYGIFALVILVFKEMSFLQELVIGLSIVGAFGFIGVGTWAINHFSHSR